MTHQPEGDVLQTYLARVAALKAAHDRALDADDLREIASDLGLTEADLAAVDAAAQAAHQRGRGHLAHGRFADAIAEFEVAAEIRPLGQALAADQAEAHLGRWRAEGRAEDREAAARHARRGLTLDPTWQRGFALLNELDAPRRGAPRPTQLLALGVTLALLGAGFAAFVLLARPTAAPRRATAPAPVVVEQVAPVAAQAPSEVAIPFELAGEQATGLTITPRFSRLNNYTERSYWKMAGELRNDGRSEIARLFVEVALLGEGDRPLLLYTTELAGRQTVPLRPGDALVFNALRQTTPALRKVRMTVRSRDEAPAPATYGTTPVAPLEWAIVKPPQFALALRERTLKVQKMSFPKGSDPIAVGQFELHNQGAAIRTLRLEMAQLDASSKRLGAYDRLVVSGDGMELRPGEVRLVRWYSRVPKAFSRYAMRVIEID